MSHGAYGAVYTFTCECGYKYHKLDDAFMKHQKTHKKKKRKKKDSK